MVALALSEDSIKKRARRDAIIESLVQLPDNVRQVGPPHRQVVRLSGALHHPTICLMASL